MEWPFLCEFYLQELHQILKGEIREKSSASVRRRERKSGHFETLSEHSLLLNEICPQEKLFYQSLTHLGERKHPILAV